MSEKPKINVKKRNWGIWFFIILISGFINIGTGEHLPSLQTIKAIEKFVVALFKGKKSISCSTLAD